jgi:hypothetical protein
MLEKQSEKSNYPIRETIRSNQVTGEYAMQLNVELPTSGVTHEKLQRFLKSLPKVKEDYDVLVYQKGHADGILFLVRSNQEIIPQTSENHVYELKDSVSPTVMRGSDLAVQLGYETIESTFMRFVDHTQQSQYATDLMTTDYQKNNSTSQMDFDRVKQTQFHIESKAHEGIYAVIGFEAKTPTKTEQILQPLIYVDGQWKLAVPEEIPTKTRDTLIQELNEKDQSSQ